MGIFKSIKKAVKSVAGGVKKVFSKAMGFVGKITQNKWFKVAMIAASVFTLGTALVAGAGAFGASAAAGNTFMTNFVAGAQQFASALANPIAAAKSQIAQLGGAAQGAAGAANTASTAAKLQSVAAQAENVSNVANAAGTTASVGTNAAANVAQAAGTVSQTGGALANATGGFTGSAIHAAGTAPGAGTGGWLSAAKDIGKAGLEFAKSQGGGQILSQAVQNYAEGKQAEEKMKEEERIRRYYDKEWANPGNFDQLASAASNDIAVPQGYLDRAARINKFLNNRQYEYPSQTAPSDQVAQYAVAK